MSKQEVSDYLLERLRAWNVQHVFGYPGDGSTRSLPHLAAPTTSPHSFNARNSSTRRPARRGSGQGAAGQGRVV
jgi:hypothetical protein